jgi:hypothetical protein
MERYRLSGERVRESAPVYAVADAIVPQAKTTMYPMTGRSHYRMARLDGG